MQGTGGYANCATGDDSREAGRGEASSLCCKKEDESFTSVPSATRTGTLLGKFLKHIWDVSKDDLLLRTLNS